MAALPLLLLDEGRDALDRAEVLGVDVVVVDLDRVLALEEGDQFGDPERVDHTAGEHVAVVGDRVDAAAGRDVIDDELFNLDGNAHNGTAPASRGFAGGAPDHQDSPSAHAPHRHISTCTVDPSGRSVGWLDGSPESLVAAIVQRALDLEEDVGRDAAPTVLLEQEEIGAVDVAGAELDAEAELAQVGVEHLYVAVDPPVVADHLIAAVGDESVESLLHIPREATVDPLAPALAVQLREPGQMPGLEVLDP